MCSEMRQLTEFFAIAARQYAEAAVRFGSVGPHRQDYAQLVLAIEQARRHTEDAFAALQRHAGPIHDFGRSGRDGALGFAQPGCRFLDGLLTVGR